MLVETSERTFRQGDSIVKVTTRRESAPVAIDFADILDATVVEPDDFMHETPWDWCDGYDHEVSRSCEWRGNQRGDCYSEASRQYVTVELAYDDELYGWYRERGATKQVAREMVALSMRNRLDTLVNWYENGWEWWQVHCDYRGAMDSLGGIDDYDYAYNDIRLECALNVAHELEQDGYEVHSKPEENDASTRRFHRQARLKLNLAMFSWTE